MFKPVFFLFVFFGIAVNQLFGQLDVRKVNELFPDVSSDGIFYSLPQTGIKVEIQVKKTQKIKGPFSEFADKYLGLSQVITLNSTEYEISTIQLSTFTEPDPSQFYFVKNTGKQKDRQALELFLSDRGALVGISGENIDEVNDKLDKKLSIAGLIIPEHPNPSLFVRVDTVIRRISVDTTTIEQKVFKKISSAKTPDQKAREAADFILKLDESMFNLINGYQEVNYEKGTMEYMYSQMDKLKNDYLQLFKGVTGITTETFNFLYLPPSIADNTPVSLCKFSISKGILEKNSIAGDIVLIEVINLNTLNSIRNVVERRNNLHKDNKGIFYCIPDEAKVSLKIGGQVKIETQFPINQFGITTFLPASIVSNLELYKTGGLKHVIVQ